MKKIAFLNDMAYEYAMGGQQALGGTERNIWFHSRALARAGWSVQVGVRSPLKPYEKRIIDGVEYIGIGQGQVVLDWYRFLSSERPDWLFWGGASHLLGPLVEIAKMTKVRTVFHAAFDADLQPRRAVFRRSRWWPLYAWGLWRADRIFVQHPGQLSILHSRLRSKASMLPKVVPLPPTTVSHANRSKHVAWVATLRQHKRPDLLIEIAKRTPDVRFVVCGGPTDYQTPEGYSMRMIKAFNDLPNVDYRGRVDPETATKVIAESSLLLCTSDEEGFPNTFTQAWSSGTPIVSLKVDPGNIIEKLGLGALSKTAEGAVAHINKLLLSAEQRNEIASRARQYISENHNEATVLDIFNRALCIPLQRVM